MSFIEYFGASHLNSKNIALYKNPRGSARLVAENIVSGKVLGALDFSDAEAAEIWFLDLGDTNVHRLDSALDILIGS